MKIKGSAYSLKNKEIIIADRKKQGLPVSIGEKPDIKDEVRYKSNKLATLKQS